MAFFKDLLLCFSGIKIIFKYKGEKALKKSYYVFWRDFSLMSCVFLKSFSLFLQDFSVANVIPNLCSSTCCSHKSFQTQAKENQALWKQEQWRERCRPTDTLKVLTVFIQEFILYVFLEKLLYGFTDLLMLLRDMIVVLGVVPLWYTCQ